MIVDYVLVFAVGTCSGNVRFTDIKNTRGGGSDLDLDV